MKKPKIKIEIYPLVCSKGYFAVTYIPNPESQNFLTKKAAREWAKEWCRTVGAALLEKGK